MPLPRFRFSVPLVLRAPWTMLAAAAIMALLAAGCGSERPPTAAAPAATDPFKDVTASSGISYRWTPGKRPLRILESVGAGCAFVDADGDGLQDVLLVGQPRCALYRNLGGGKFVDITAGSGLDVDGHWIGCAIGDYDRDGDPDLYVTGYLVSALFRNDGKGRFTNVTDGAGVGLKKWSTAAVFADFDRDGWQDLYVGCYLEFGPDSKQYCSLHKSVAQSSCRPFDYDAQQGVLFRNNGKGGFEDVTRKWGADTVRGKCLGASVADYDGDGWPDLFLANDEVEQDLLHNEGGKRFRNLAIEAGVAYSGNGQVPGGMGVDWGDIDSDGKLDLALGTYSSEPKILFRNLGDGAFEYISGTAGILADTYPMVVFGTLLFDYDNDGRVDLLFLNGHTMDNIEMIEPTTSYRQEAVLFRNLDGHRFQRVSSPSVEVPMVGRGLACGDYDNDGDQDLLLADMDGEAHLMENRSTDNNWLLLDIPVNGAIVRAKSATTRTLQEVRTGRSYLSACDPRVPIGLGKSDQAEEILITWPGGKKTELRNVRANQIVEISPPSAGGRKG